MTSTTVVPGKARWTNFVRAVADQLDLHPECDQPYQIDGRGAWWYSVTEEEMLTLRRVFPGDWVEHEPESLFFASHHVMVIDFAGFKVTAVGSLRVGYAIDDDNQIVEVSA